MGGRGGGGGYFKNTNIRTYVSFFSAQFEKIEQFCVTTPDDDASWTMLEDMIGASEAFYKCSNHTAL